MAEEWLRSPGLLSLRAPAEAGGALLDQAPNCWAGTLELRFRFRSVRVPIRQHGGLCYRSCFWVLAALPSVPMAVLRGTRRLLLAVGLMVVRMGLDGAGGQGWGQQGQGEQSDADEPGGARKRRHDVGLRRWHRVDRSAATLLSDARCTGSGCHLRGPRALRLRPSAPAAPSGQTPRR